MHDMGHAGFWAASTRLFGDPSLGVANEPAGTTKTARGCDTAGWFVLRSALFVVEGLD